MCVCVCVCACVRLCVMLAILINRASKNMLSRTGHQKPCMASNSTKQVMAVSREANSRLARQQIVCLSLNSK